MKNVYLSIDLDYWSREYKPQSATRFFRRLLRNFGRPIMVAVHHHHLLRHINSTRGFDTLINVDFHSDLKEYHEDKPTEANWVNFVNFQGQGTYIWRFPSESCLSLRTGYCHSDDSPFEHNLTGWAHVRKRQGIARIPWDSVREVGVCLSPGWLNPKTVAYPIDVLGLYDWAGRWWALNDLEACNGLPDSVITDMENGTGIFQPRLIRPECGV